MPTRRLGLIGLACAAFVLAACGGDGNAEETPTATAPRTETASPPTTTATPTDDEAEAAVRQAYLAYWDAYSEAMLRRDATLMEGFAAGTELEAIRNEIEQLRADGRAVRIVVEHDIELASLSENEAFLLDEYLNNSYLVDPETLEGDATAGPNEVIRDIFRLERIDGRWVVVQGGRVAR